MSHMSLVVTDIVDVQGRYSGYAGRYSGYAGKIW